MSLKQVVEIIELALKDIAEVNNIKVPAINENVSLYGVHGCLDSLGLVSLISGIESRLLEKGIYITIASEKAFSKKVSPFLTVKTLARFIAGII
ncbi:MAG: hypothetical protein JXA79_07355, partial [Deltaproteobacteria bacterium]|nr:hypothetical protein [Deltaproteobacteria bacterium]